MTAFRVRFPEFLTRKNKDEEMEIRSSGRTDISISKAPVGVGVESKNYRTIPRRSGRYFSVIVDSFQEISEKAIKSLRKHIQTK